MDLSSKVPRREDTTRRLAENCSLTKRAMRSTESATASISKKFASWDCRSGLLEDTALPIKCARRWPQEPQASKWERHSPIALSPDSEATTKKRSLKKLFPARLMWPRIHPPPPQIFHSRLFNSRGAYRKMKCI